MADSGTLKLSTGGAGDCPTWALATGIWGGTVVQDGAFTCLVASERTGESSSRVPPCSGSEEEALPNVASAGLRTLGDGGGPLIAALCTPAEAHARLTGARPGDEVRGLETTGGLEDLELPIVVIWGLTVSCLVAVAGLFVVTSEVNEWWRRGGLIVRNCRFTLPGLSARGVCGRGGCKDEVAFDIIGIGGERRWFACAHLGLAGS